MVNEEQIKLLIFGSYNLKKYFWKQMIFFVFFSSNELFVQMPQKILSDGKIFAYHK